MSNLTSKTYSTANVSETTLVDTSSTSSASKPGLEVTPKSSLKTKLKNKLNMSYDPKKHVEPTKSWEARAMAIL